MSENEKPTKGWTDRRRKQQACNARRNKPWQSSTGPKTGRGKAASRLNALKHGHYAIGYEKLEEALRLHRAFLRNVRAWDAAILELDRILVKKQTEGKCMNYKGILPRGK